MRAPSDRLARRSLPQPDLRNNDRRGDARAGRSPLGSRGRPARSRGSDAGGRFKTGRHSPLHHRRAGSAQRGLPDRDGGGGISRLPPCCRDGVAPSRAHEQPACLGLEAGARSVVAAAAVTAAAIVATVAVTAIAIRKPLIVASLTAVELPLNGTVGISPEPVNLARRTSAAWEGRLVTSSAGPILEAVDPVVEELSDSFLLPAVEPHGTVQVVEIAVGATGVTATIVASVVVSPVAGASLRGKAFTLTVKLLESDATGERGGQRQQDE